MSTTLGQNTDDDDRLEALADIAEEFDGEVVGEIAELYYESLSGETAS
jgi:hypothetical protein